jgi:hypothetical protein
MHLGKKSDYRFLLDLTRAHAARQHISPLNSKVLLKVWDLKRENGAGFRHSTARRGFATLSLVGNK